MANTYYDSQLTAAEIESALEAVKGVIVPANNGKVLYINNGKIAAKSVVPGGAVLESLSVTQNGDYYPGTGVDGFDEVHVNVSGGITPTGTLVIRENGIYDITNYANVNVNVGGGTETALIPVMTSNTTPSGTASASSILNSSFDAYKAFDGNQAQSSMQGGWLASASDYTPHLQYEFASAAQLNLLKVWTANNGATATRDVTIEGRKNGVWENCLENGQTTTLTFTQGTYGSATVLHSIYLNGSTYDAIRITGNDRFYLGINQTACTFSEVQVYTVS